MDGWMQGRAGYLLVMFERAFGFVIRSGQGVVDLPFYAFYPVKALLG